MYVSIGEAMSERQPVNVLALPGLGLQRRVWALPIVRPWLMRGVLALSDLFAFCLAASLAIEAPQLWSGRLDLSAYAELWPFLIAFSGTYAAMGLYQGSEVNAVQEVRRCTISASLSFAMLAVAGFLMKQTGAYSRAVFLLGWVQTLVYVPLIRNLVRGMLAKCDWWGHAAVVIGAGPAAQRILAALKKHPEFGLKPVAVLDDRTEARHVAGIPVAGGVAMAPVLARAGVSYAIVAQPELAREELLEVFSKNSEVFTHMLLAPDLLGMSSLWVETADLGGLLTLRIRHQLLLPGARITKQILDKSLALLLAFALAPLIALLAVLIRATSRGPAFYSQGRLGRDGRLIRVWKFRTMAADADQALEAYLQRRPELREEWARERKLRDDPRVTAVGRFLRRMSLDELPQIWNVLRGEMSLVGPRPIVEAEIPKYGASFDLYRRVTPGITGLWQVSGRSDTGYGERVGLDVYYVRNWSVWLDLFILAQTVRVVVSRKGAY